MALRLRRHVAVVGASVLASLAAPSTGVAQAPTIEIPPSGSTIGVPGPWEDSDPGPGVNEATQFEFLFSVNGCHHWQVFVTTMPAVGGGWIISLPDLPPNPVRLSLPRSALPMQLTMEGGGTCYPLTGVPVDIYFTATYTLVDGPGGVTPPSGSPTGPGESPTDPGTSGAPESPGAACPAAESLLSQARTWNSMAQRYRGLSVEAGRAVIDYANLANAAFWKVLGNAALSVPSDKITEKAVKELARAEEIDGYRQLWQNSLNGKWPDIARQMVVLREMRKFLEGLGRVGRLGDGLDLAEALAYLGLAAQQGVLRDSWDALADDHLRKANELQRLAGQACGATANPGRATRLAATARQPKKPRYTELAKAKPTKGFRVSSSLGLRGRLVPMLNKLLAGQDRTVALARAIEASVSRAHDAARARSAKWEVRQLGHARATARKLAAHLDRQARHREQSGRSLTGPARQGATIEITNAAGLSKVLRKLGLPPMVTDTLKRLGLRPRLFRRLFTSPPSGTLTLPPLAEAVADPAGVARDRAWAADLRLFAAGR